MRCTSGRSYLPGMKDRPCNQPLIGLPFYALKNRKKEHDDPVLICPHCDGLRRWPDPLEKENP